MGGRWTQALRRRSSGAGRAGSRADDMRALRRRLGAAVLVVLAIVVAVSLLTTSTDEAAGIAVGQRIPPFAVPLATSGLTGDANVATHADDGAAGRVPACDVHLAGALNVCSLYARGPVALALFVNAGSCTPPLDDLAALAGRFPGVTIAAVAIRGDRTELRALVRAHHWPFAVGWDRDGTLADLYHLSGCPQITFVARGGRVAEPALLGGEADATTLRQRLGRLSP